jgi:Ca-activated chloride channel homolog
MGAAIPVPNAGLTSGGDDGGLTDAEQLLRRLADETGGAYWKIGSATQLQEVYELIDRLERSEIKSAILYHAEISALFQYFALTALAVLLVERILCATWLRVAEEVDR